MNIALKVDVPIASFPTSRSREYRDTYPVPPPSTVYGMLLSLVGETDRYKHCGVQIAIALLAEPEKSVTFRKTRRFKYKKLNHPENTRPDFQEIRNQKNFCKDVCLLNYIWDLNIVKAFCTRDFEDFKTSLDACKILKAIALLNLRVYFFLILEDFICNFLIANTFHAFLSQRLANASILAFALQLN